SDVNTDNETIQQQNEGNNEINPTEKIEEKNILAIENNEIHNSNSSISNTLPIDEVKKESTVFSEENLSINLHNNANRQPQAQKKFSDVVTNLSKENIFHHYENFLKSTHDNYLKNKINTRSSAANCKILIHLTKFDSPPRSHGKTFHCYELYCVIRDLGGIYKIPSMAKVAKELGFGALGSRIKEWMSANHILDFIDFLLGGNFYKDRDITPSHLQYAPTSKKISGAVTPVLDSEDDGFETKAVTKENIFMSSINQDTNEDGEKDEEEELTEDRENHSLISTGDEENFSGGENENSLGVEYEKSHHDDDEQGISFFLKEAEEEEEEILNEFKLEMKNFEMEEFDEKRNIKKEEFEEEIDLFNYFLNKKKNLDLETIDLIIKATEKSLKSLKNLRNLKKNLNNNKKRKLSTIFKKKKTDDDEDNNDEDDSDDNNLANKKLKLEHFSDSFSDSGDISEDEEDDFDEEEESNILDEVEMMEEEIPEEEDALSFDSEEDDEEEEKSESESEISENEETTFFKSMTDSERLELILKSIINFSI
ncbi:hypothetical protein HDU92_006249, partial [Lobulomyces angularis]